MIIYLRTKAKYIIPLIIYITAVALFMWSARLNPSSDSISEFTTLKDIYTYGWNPFTTEAHNNTSIVIGWLIPVLKMNPLDVYHYVLPCIYAFTPVILYLLFKRLFNVKIAILSAMFFFLLPPSFQEVTVIGKSMVAEPLAALALYFAFSDYKYRMPLLIVSMILCLWSHYTVGFFLVGWLLLLATYRMIKNRDKSLITPAFIGVLFQYIYYSFASGGRVLINIGYQQLLNIDYQQLLGYSEAQQSLSNRLMLLEPMRGGWLGIVLSVLYVFILAVMIIGFWELLKTKMWEYIVLASVTGLVVALALFIKPIQYPLLISRWVQLGSITLSPIYALGASRISYIVSIFWFLVFFGLVVV